MSRAKQRYATNEELIAITGVSRQSLALWVKRGLLPKPTIISDGRNGVRSRWPHEAVERAKFIAEARGKMYTLREIEALVREYWPEHPEEAEP